MHFLAPDISQEHSVVVVIAPFYRQHTEIQRGQRLIRRHINRTCQEPGFAPGARGPRSPAVRCWRTQSREGRERDAGPSRPHSRVSLPACEVGMSSRGERTPVRCAESPVLPRETSPEKLPSGAGWTSRLSTRWDSALPVAESLKHREHKGAQRAHRAQLGPRRVRPCRLPPLVPAGAARGVQAAGTMGLRASLGTPNLLVRTEGTIKHRQSRLPAESQRKM